MTFSFRWRRLIWRAVVRGTCGRTRWVENAGAAERKGDLWMEQPKPHKPPKIYLVTDVEIDERGRPHLEVLEMDEEEIPTGTIVAVCVTLAMVVAQIVTLYLLLRSPS